MLPLLSEPAVVGCEFVGPSPLSGGWLLARVGCEREEVVEEEEGVEVGAGGGLRQLWLGLEVVPCVTNTGTKRKEVEREAATV